MNKDLCLNDISYCGINCRKCNLTTALPRTAHKLYEIMRSDGWENWGSIVHPEFEQFWKVLHSLAGMEEHCPMCRGNCGNPECQFRICAREKGLDLCANCADYPCPSLSEFLSGRYSFVRENNQKIREQGLENWLKAESETMDNSRTNQGMDMN